jgi:hypothetical protein
MQTQARLGKTIDLCVLRSRKRQRVNSSGCLLISNNAVNGGAMGGEIASDDVGKVNGVVFGGTHGAKLNDEARKWIPQKGTQRELASRAVTAGDEVHAVVRPGVEVDI